MLEIITIISVLFIFYILKKQFIFDTTQHGAPFFSTSVETLKQAIDMLDIKPGQVFYELGSGDGRAVIYAAMKGAKAYGVEISWLRVMYSRAWIFLLRLSHQAKIIHGNFFDVNLKDADIVFIYLLPSTNEKLGIKFKKELEPGAKVISIGFPFENWHPVKTNLNVGPIFLYKI